jgi:hypothetical protein
VLRDGKKRPNSLPHGKLREKNRITVLPGRKKALEIKDLGTRLGMKFGRRQGNFDNLLTPGSAPKL